MSAVFVSVTEKPGSWVTRSGITRGIYEQYWFLDPAQAILFKRVQKKHAFNTYPKLVCFTL